MSPKFGNFLSHNKRDRNSAHGPVKESADSSKNALFIRISRASIDNDSLALCWDDLSEDFILLPLQSIQGLRDGSPRVSARELWERAPSLFKSAPSPELSLALRLPAIVPQIADLLPEAPEPAEIVEQAFDTPFRRHAEEDVARAKQQRAHLISSRPELDPLFPEKKPKADEPEFEPEDRPEIPLEFLREQPPKVQTNVEERLEVPDQSVSIPGQPKQPAASIENTSERQEEVRIPVEGAEKSSLPGNGSAQAQSDEPLRPERLIRSLPLGVLESTKPIKEQSEALYQRRRGAQQRLQELFLTEENLDAARVCEEILKLPKLEGVVIFLREEIAGGMLPENCLLRSESIASLRGGVAELAKFFVEFSGETLSSLTLGGSKAQSISLVEHGQTVILVVHQGRLVPGLREKLLAVAEALSDEI